MRRKRMDHQGARTAARWRETLSGQSGPIFLRAADAPLPDGVETRDAGVFVIRLVAPTPAETEAENVAY
jgi:hypothetical protein